MKTCTKCRITKPLSEFFKSKKSQCKACHNEYTKKRTARDPHWLRRWREENPLAHKQWYQKNQQHKAEYFAKWRADHKETEPARIKNWAEANPHKVNANTAKRIAAKYRAIPKWADKSAIVEIYERAARLRGETGERYEVDHIVPLQGKIVTGLHWEGNLQILLKAENISKHNRRWPDMP